MNPLKKYLNFHLDLDERIESFKQGKQYSCEIEVTNKCNFSCSYCYASANTETKNVMNYEIISDLLTKLLSYGIKEIGWIGGEPLTHNDIDRFVLLASAMGFKQALYTNAALLHDFKYLHHIDRIIVHVDSFDVDIWAKGQNKPNLNNFRRMIANLTLLTVSYPMNKVIVSVPLTRDCFNDLDTTLGITRDLGCQFINLIPLTPLGNSKDLSKFITPEEIWIAMEKRAKVLDKPWLMQLGISEYCKQFQLTDVTIKYNGDVLPYIDDFRVVGNIFKEDISVILEKNSDKLRLKEWTNDNSLGNNADICKDCINKKYCFGNPVSRVDPKVVPDIDCKIVKRENG